MENAPKKEGERDGADTFCVKDGGNDLLARGMRRESRALDG